MGSHCLYASGFRYCFTPLTGVLFAFPSRYWFAIGQLRVFSLGGWSPLVPKDSSGRVSRAPPYSISRHGRFRVRGCHPYGAPFQSASANADCKQSFPSRLRADPLSLIATWGISVDFFSSGYLDISVPRVCLARLFYSARNSQRIGWVSPFGNPRIKVCCRLPEAYRRLPRPSSPSAAKASTECACSLDHITQPARAWATWQSNVAGYLAVGGSILARERAIGFAPRKHGSA